MRWPGHLRKAVFLERNSRFHGRVRDGRRVRTVHIPNSGRLGELLFPGNRVGYRPRRANLDRRTEGTVLLAQTPSGGWASIDARLPPRLLLEYLQGSQVSSWGRLRTWRLEPAIPLEGHRGRLDLWLETNRGAWWVETKSVTLVRDSVGYFPDAVTVRGRHHVEALTAMHRAGYPVALIFVVQRSDARAAAVDGQTDPALYEAVERARVAGVPVRAFACRVTWRSVRIDREIPFAG
ncbi:MAG: DNA/RNA nuclease SfsA [Acidobacteria bacterium]|nr:DNA/RNA nuclease SfsA [Acidobacteriota bacterium]MDW7984669.1 DNA/RNA nuclease SfsA [Acidobacteriota bacterium]